MLTIEIEMRAAPQRYEILLEPGLFDDWRREIEERVTSDKYIVLMDENVAAIHGLPEDGAVEGNWHYLRFGAGEEGKRLANYNALVERVFAFNPHRDSVMVGLGGVTTGGMAGFLAATIRYGLRLALVPTSLSGQIDNSVGGWNRINTHRVHNGLGLVWQPQLVLIDPAVLDTLPREEFLAGAAEVVRSAVVDGPDFFHSLERGRDQLLARNHGYVAGVIARCCRMKTDLVVQGGRYEGPRQLLRLGHDFGGMLEQLAGYDGRVRHGEAVGVGMVMAGELSRRRGSFSREEQESIVLLLRELELPTTIAELGRGRVDWRRLLLEGDGAARALLRANDNALGNMSLVLPHGIGRCRVEQGFTAEYLMDFVRSCVSSRP